MRFEIVTIFPGFFAGIFEHGIVRRAQANALVSVGVHDLREFTHDRHRTVDDRPFGGGEGMVLKPEPLAEALGSLGIEPKPPPPAEGLAMATRVILLSAQGRPFNQSMARELAGLERVVLICGRYEGVDERIAERFVDLEVSIGDFVITGGELAAMVVMDAVTRLLPGALGNADSADQDSFEGHRLDCGHYTRPPEFQGRPVPDVLLTGNHELIADWRRADGLMRTLVRRPDLLRVDPLDTQEVALLEKWRQEIDALLRSQHGSGPGSLPGDG